MEIFKEVFLVVLGILAVILFVIFCIGFPISYIQVNFFNAEFGTEYTAWEWMFNKSTIEDLVLGAKLRLH